MYVYMYTLNADSHTLKTRMFVWEENINSIQHNNYDSNNALIIIWLMRR